MLRLAGPAAVIVTGLVMACGGGSPTGPAAPTPPSEPAVGSGTTIRLTSGETDQPVEGATITLAGVSAAGAFTQTYTTKADGTILLDRSIFLTPAANLDIKAAGYLDRATYLRQNETAMTLWPQRSTSGLDDEFSSTAVYSASTCPAQNTGTAILRRLPSATSAMRVTFDDTLQDSRAQAAHEQAINRLNAASADSRYSFAPGATGENVFIAGIDPTHATCTAGAEPLRASTSLTLRNGEVVGGRLTYCTVDAARALPLVLHELGHSSGLYHSPSQRDVMYCTSGRPADFSSRERLALKLMRQRRAGNRWPDNDRSALAPLAVTEAVTINCGDGVGPGR